MTAPSDSSITRTVMLLHSGDQHALQQLLTEYLPWIEARVRRRLSAEARLDGETQDFVQEALLDVLQNGPRFAVESPSAFRALLARIVENTLIDRHRYMHRDQRDRRRQCALPSDSVLLLDAPVRTITSAAACAETNERAAWMRLALELVSPEDREIIRLRDWDGLSFVAAGDCLGVSEEAARKRYVRALPRLAEKFALLRDGQWRQTIDVDC